SSSSALRAVRTTFAPSRAAARAAARPIPLVAPVITMTCSLIGLSETAMARSPGLVMLTNHGSPRRFRKCYPGACRLCLGRALDDHDIDEACVLAQLPSRRVLGRVGVFACRFEAFE